MLDRLQPGVVVTGTRIDRLARSTFDLFGIVKRIVDAKAQFRSLAEPWANTGTSTGRLMLAVLGGLADDAECTVMRSDAVEIHGERRAQPPCRVIRRAPLAMFKPCRRFLRERHPRRGPCQRPGFMSDLSP